MCLNPHALIRRSKPTSNIPAVRIPDRGNLRLPGNLVEAAQIMSKLNFCLELETRFGKADMGASGAGFQHH
jgi:hypothetical protein